MNEMKRRQFTTMETNLEEMEQKIRQHRLAILRLVLSFVAMGILVIGGISHLNCH